MTAAGRPPPSSEERTRHVAARYAAAGLQRGDRLVLSAAPSIDLVVAHVAALRLGLVVVPVNGAYGQREVDQLARDCEPAAAVVDDRERGRWVAEASGRPVVVTGPDVDLPDGPEVSIDDVGPGDPGLIIYTSGTTGTPKGALLSHGNLLASASAVALAWRWTPRRPARARPAAVPRTRARRRPARHADRRCSGGAASAASTPTTVLDSVRERQATLFFGVPTMYAQLAGSPRLPELAALRLAVSGSAALSRELFTAVAERGGQRILERYGMSETLMNVSNPYDGERRPGTVGFPLPGVELRLADGTDEVLVRGPNVFAGYWNRPEATAEAFDARRLVPHAATSVPWTTDGYLRIVGPKQGTHHQRRLQRLPARGRGRRCARTRRRRRRRRSVCRIRCGASASPRSSRRPASRRASSSSWLPGSSRRTSGRRRS